MSAIGADQMLPVPRDRRRHRDKARVAVVCCLSLLTVGTMAPFVAMVVVALSPAGEPTIPTAWPSRLTLDNVTRAFRMSGMIRWALNSAIVSLVTVVLSLVTSSMAAYAFAKHKFPGRDAIFWAIVATLMIPFQATMIPLFILANDLGWIDSYAGLIVPMIANTNAVFLLRQFIREIPHELFEAAKVDGAGELRMFVLVVVPQLKSIGATLAVFLFLWNWNDFLWPLVIAQSDSMKTLTVGLSTLAGKSPLLPELMGTALVGVIPCLIVFAFLQRYLVESISTTGLR